MQVFLNSLLANIALWFGLILLLLVIRFFKEKLLSKVNFIMAITVWLILSLVFLWFLPKLFKSGVWWEQIWFFILIWLSIFYVLELLVHWHHCHELWKNDLDHNKIHKNSFLMFSSTLVHNMLHWIVLFSAFSLSFTVWVITTIWVFLHSIPQNIANYFTSMKNEKLVYIAAVWWVIWTLILFPFKEFLLENKPLIISMICGWLLYTALADILPENKNMETIKWKILYLLFIVIWVFIFLWLHSLEKIILS